MIYPHFKFKEDYNTTAGYFYGDPTSYGFHDGIDVNDNGAGDSDLGKPILAICDGEVTSVHFHTTKPTFGNHLHYKITGPWGERWVHHGHCQNIYVSVGDMIKEGQTIATIGNSGTDWAHDHWAIKNQPTGVDSVAHNLDELKMWDNPLTFVESWLGYIGDIEMTITDQTKIPQIENKEVQAIASELKDLRRDNASLSIDKDNLTKQLAECKNSTSESASILQQLRELFRKILGG